MLNNRYTLTTAEDFMSYEFDSVGPKGTIRKLVQYTRITDTSAYNLGFGDKDPSTNEIDDLVISNNGDSIKVLATVAETAFSFLDRYPQASIFASGSTNSRTKLYRIGISNHLGFIQTKYRMLGYKDERWHIFQRNIDYEAFLIERKNSKFEI